MLIMEAGTFEHKHNKPNIKKQEKAFYQDNNGYDCLVEMKF